MSAGSPAGKVLIIDDEEPLRRTLARILQSCGCQTGEAGSGRAALESLSRETFDLIYLDIHLPDMSGIELLEQLRRRQVETPVILLTGYGTLQTAMDAVRLGALDYLLKPYDPEIMVARTRSVLHDEAAHRRKAELRGRLADLDAERQALQLELQALERRDPDGAVSSERSTPLPPDSSPQKRYLKAGRLVLDLHARRATHGERVLALPPAAFDYLYVLARRTPEVVDYRTLVTEAQGYAVDAAEARRLAKWHVHSIRQALEPDPRRPRCLITVRGEGYRLILD